MCSRRCLHLALEVSLIVSFESAYAGSREMTFVVLQAVPATNAPTDGDNGDGKADAGGRANGGNQPGMADLCTQ